MFGMGFRKHSPSDPNWFKGVWLTETYGCFPSAIATRILLPTAFSRYFLAFRKPFTRQRRLAALVCKPSAY